jgi:hypothetical protein
VTQPLWPILTGLLLLASPARGACVAGRPAEDPSGWQTPLEGYSRLSPAAQQDWIRDLLDRLDRANRVVLAPDEAAAEQARHALLRGGGWMPHPPTAGRVAGGGTIPHSGLLQLLRQTDQREKAAIERLARRFRMRVYDTFRLQRGEYTRRRAAWDHALATWEAAGRPFDQQPRLIDWLEAATRNCTRGSVAPLPDPPSFEPLGEVPQPVSPVASPPQPNPPGDGGYVRVPYPPIAPGWRTPGEPAGGQTQPSGPVLPPTAATMLRDQPSVGALPERSPPVPPQQPSARRQPSGPTAADKPSPLPVRRSAELPLIWEPSTPADIPPIQPAPPGIAALVVGDGARRAAGSLSKIGGQPAAHLPPSGGEVPLPSAAYAFRRIPPSEVTTAASSRVGQPPSRSLPIGGATPTPARVGGPAALEPKSHGVPAAISQVEDSSRRVLPGTRPHRVNLDELATRIAGANLALQALEAELDKDDPWNARRLAPLVDRLGILVLRRNDLALFQGLIWPPERARVGHLSSPQAAISRLAARIFEARTHASGPNFIGSQPERRAELRELDELSRQLAEMASPK